MCALFVVLPAAAATESTNTENTVVTNASTDQELKMGMTGDNVTELQTWLKNQGFYTGEIDGEFGNYTELAVKYFQGYVGIKEDGVVGNVSRQSMDDLVNGNIEASESTSSSGSYSSKSSYSQSSYSGAAYGTSKSYSNSYSYSSSGWSSGKGTGDCWDNSNVLYSQLTSSGTKARIVQYPTSYSSNHRSVQVWSGSGWVDYDYKGNGYSNRYYATSGSSSGTVIASS